MKIRTISKIDEIALFNEIWVRSLSLYNARNWRVTEICVEDKAAFILWNSKVYKDLEEVKTSKNEWISVQKNWSKLQAIGSRIVCITVAISVTNLNWNTIHIEVGGYDSIRISEKADVVAAGTNLHHFCLGCRKYKDDICEIL